MAALRKIPIELTLKSESSKTEEKCPEVDKIPHTYLVITCKSCQSVMRRVSQTQYHITRSYVEPREMLNDIITDKDVGLFFQAHQLQTIEKHRIYYENDKREITSEKIFENLSYNVPPPGSDGMPTKEEFGRIKQQLDELTKSLTPYYNMYTIHQAVDHLYAAQNHLNRIIG